MKYYILIAIILSSTLALISASSANAVSESDNVMASQTMPITIGSKTFESSFAIGEFLGSTEATNAVNNCEGFSNNISIEYFEQIKYYISQDRPTIVTTLYGNTIEVSVQTISQPITYDWTSDTLTAISPEPTWASLRIGNSTSRGIIICGNNDGFYGSPVQSFAAIAQTTWRKVIEITNMNIVYPSGYEGEKIGGDSTVAEPKIGYSVFDNYELKAYSSADENFCLPTDLGGCIVPDIKYRITDTDDVLVVEQTLEEWQMFTHKFDKAGNYLLYVTYVHPGSPYAEFSSSLVFNTVKFELPVLGIFYNGGNAFQTCSTDDNVTTCQANTVDMVSCVTNEFPYLDVPGCYRNIQSLLNVLSFNLMKPINPGLTAIAQNNPNACYSLGTLGTWLNRPAQVICPAFPSSIRDVVTPFVTFILGATIFTYISRRSSSVIS